MVGKRDSGKRTRTKGRAGNENRDSLPATGGKDLGKLKGVAIDYLTRHGHEANFGSWFESQAPMGLRPSSACRTKRRQAHHSVHEQKRGSMNLVERTSHARTHARTHVISPRTFVRVRSPSLASSLSIFLYLYRRTRYGWYRGRNFDVGKTEKNLFEPVKIRVNWGI